MRRREFLFASVVALAATPASIAQPASRPARIGMLVPALTPNEPAFLEGMKDLGWVDGSNIVIERRSAEGDFSRLPGLAAELVKLKPDVIVAFVTQASIAAKRATGTIPIVIAAVGDPVASGLVTNLARPGGNVTGTASQGSAFVGKQFEVLRELRPAAVRVAVLWNPANAVFQEQSVREARAAAERLGLDLRLSEARSAAEIDRALAAIAAERPDGVVVLGEPLFVANAERIAELLLRHRLLAIGGNRRYTQVGMLATYGPDYPASARRAAVYVDRILRGAKPGDLPVEQVDKFELILNAKTAKALGIAIPRDLLLRADEVIR